MGVMNRSLINNTIDEVLEYIGRFNMVLPRFGYFSPEDWKKRDLKAYQEVFDLELGWDISDFGGNDWSKWGCSLFTLRNGAVSEKMQPLYPNPYAEKLLYVRRDQELPYHFHRHKMEDIINRGGGDLMIQIYKSTPEGELDTKTLVPLTIDGERKLYQPGEIIKISHGSAVRVNPYDYHRFWAERAPVMCWEVSKTNDDHTDNRFLTEGDRFSEIIEDEAPRYILCNEYEKQLGVKKSV